MASSSESRRTGEARRPCAARQPSFKGLQQVRPCAARQARASGAVPPWPPPLPPPPVSIWRGDGQVASISRGDGQGRLDGRPFRAMARSPRYRGEPCSQTNCRHFSGPYISSQAARVPYLSSRTMHFSGPYINSEGDGPARLEIESLQPRPHTAIRPAASLSGSSCPSHPAGCELIRAHAHNRGTESRQRRHDSRQRRHDTALLSESLTLARHGESSATPFAATARAHTHTHTSCSRPGQRAGPGTTGPPRPTRAKARAHAHTHTHTHEVQGQKAGPPSESLATIRVTNRYQHGGEEGSAGTNGHVTVCSLSRSTLFRATGQHTGPRFVNPCTYKAAAAL